MRDSYIYCVLMLLGGSLFLQWYYQPPQFSASERFKAEILRLKGLISDLDAELEELRPYKYKSRNKTNIDIAFSAYSHKHSHQRKKLNPIDHDTPKISHVVMFGQEAEIIPSNNLLRREKHHKKQLKSVDFNKTHLHNISALNPTGGKSLILHLEDSSNKSLIVHQPIKEIIVNISVDKFQNETMLVINKEDRYTSLVKSDQLYYIYPLDEEYWWRWPDPGTDCTETGYLGHEHSELSGLGRPLNLTEGLFLTWHFSLFSSVYARLIRSRRRTLDPEKASLFIIPYDLAMDGYVNPSKCRMRKKCSDGFVTRLEKYLRDSKYFQRHNGADHAVIWSLGQYHPWPVNRCDLFIRNLCSKCTFTCYWMDPTKEDNKFVSVPFPSAYHWLDEIKTLPWAVTAPGTRNITAVYLGSVITLNPTHTKIRRAMTAQCEEHKDCLWAKIGHSSIDNTIGSSLSVYRKSTFCLCPPGDDPARKAVFDSILSGCIPVIFECGTIFNQYPWHLGESLAQDISVHVPGGKVRAGKLQFMEFLMSISPDTIRKKQEAIAKLAPRLQYSAPPIEYLKNHSDSTPWDPPFPDGVDVIIDGMLLRTERVVNNQSTGIPIRLMQTRRWGEEYDRPIAKVPDVTSDFISEFFANSQNKKKQDVKYFKTADIKSTPIKISTSRDYY